MNFNKELILRENTVVHCKTEEEVIALLKWSSSQLHPNRCDKSDFFYMYNENTCYNARDNTFSSIGFYLNERYTIIEFEDALQKEQEINIEASFLWRHKITKEQVHIDRCIKHEFTVKFIDSKGRKQELINYDFLSLYEPYEPIYEYQFVFELNSKCNGYDNKYIYPHSDKEYYTKEEASAVVLKYVNYEDCHCLEFTKQERVVK
ncbi:MAG: hypothetical protein PHF21_02720 [Bacilli bacterium]|nr:hypothetical protein [Bacilli bacterium]